MYITRRLPSQETESGMSFSSLWDFLQIYKYIDQSAWCSTIAFVLASSLLFLFTGNYILLRGATKHL